MQICLSFNSRHIGHICFLWKKWKCTNVIKVLYFTFVPSMLQYKFLVALYGQKSSYRINSTSISNFFTYKYDENTPIDPLIIVSCWSFTECKHYNAEDRYMQCNIVMQNQNLATLFKQQLQIPRQCFRTALSASYNICYINLMLKAELVHTIHKANRNFIDIFLVSKH